MNISENIKWIRESKNLSQMEIAKILQIKRSNYHKLESKGNKLTMVQIESIAKALNVSLQELLEFDTPAQPPKALIEHKHKPIVEKNYLVYFRLSWQQRQQLHCNIWGLKMTMETQSMFHDIIVEKCIERVKIIHGQTSRIGLEEITIDEIVLLN